jgi:uncharacterized membrane protein
MLEGWEWIIIMVLGAFIVTAIVVIVVVFLSRHNPLQNTSIPTPVQNSSNDTFQKLQQLKTMLDKGLITQEDYDEQKKRILATV